MTPSDHMFLAVASPHFTYKEAEIFSPIYMQWSPHLWFIDITACLTYWKTHAHAKNLSLTEFFNAVLQRLPSLSESHFQATLSPSCWQALLILLTMESRNLNGIIHANERLGFKIYHQMTWAIWWQALVDLSHKKPFDKPIFRQNQKLMRQSIQRLGLASPWDLQDASLASIQRRFGTHMRVVWEWTFCEETDAQSEFPWEKFTPPLFITYKKNLDYPTNDWEHIKPLLQDSLNQLCRQPGMFETEKVLQIAWAITLNDLTSFQISIRFQHPHNLHLDSPHHETSLIQAYHAFKSFMERQFPNDLDECLNPCPPIIAWELTITQKILLPPQVIDLFGDQSSQPEMLLDLENKLPIQLLHFSENDDWLPEDSFLEKAEKVTETHRRLSLSLTALAQKRPLFILSNPQAIKKMPLNQKNMQFAEATMDKWWASPNDERYYYKVTTATQHLLWVFQDSAGRWFIHGVFG